jgi:feruloyl esterase
MQKRKWVFIFVAAGILAGSAARVMAQAGDCAGLKNVVIAGTAIGSAEAVAAGSPAAGPPGFPASTGPMPQYCKVLGVIHDRTGADGKHYGIRFELRLPANWNGKFFFQGGGGTDGSLSPAIGMTGRGTPTALQRGYAVAADDGGHQGAADTSFGREQQARLDYAFESTPAVTRVAKQLVAAYYGKPPAHSYFVGCSNGGREAMMAIERDPLEFDGAIAGDPGFRLTHAAIAEAWDTQTFTAIAPRDGQGNPILSKAFSNADLKLVADAVLAKCDGLDGIKDGEINNFSACKFDPAEIECKGAKTAECLSREQVEALKRSFGGAHDSHGNPIYSSWPYDAGIGDMGWRMWKLGTSETAEPNAINTTMGAHSLIDYFVHPYVDGLDPMKLDFDRAAALVDETSRINDAVDTDLSTFAAHGGRLLIYQGLSDPVFSADDIIDYYRRLERDNGGAERARDVARLFLIPGMTHCGGGPATDRFDALDALEKWVEQGQAPQSIMATGQAFPNRTRPLCPYPQYAAYNGSGDPEDGRNFTCKNPD